MFKKKHGVDNDDDEYDQILASQNDPMNKKRLNKYRLMKYANMDCKFMLETMSSELEDIEADINKEVQLQKSLPTNNKLNQIEIDEKFKYVDKLKKRLNEFEDYLIYLYDEKKIKQNELDVLENCYVKLKEIYINKTSSETLGKIFYGLPLPTFKLVSNNSGGHEKNDIQPEKNKAKDSTAALVSLVFHNSYGILL